MTKELSYVMLKPYNVRMKPSNVRKNSKETTKCKKKTITFNIETVQCEDGIIKYEKKVKESPNVKKELSHMMLKLYNVRMEPSSVRKK